MITVWKYSGRRNTQSFTLDKKQNFLYNKKENPQNDH